MHEAAPQPPVPTQSPPRWPERAPSAYNAVRANLTDRQEASSARLLSVIRLFSFVAAKVLIKQQNNIVSQDYVIEVL